MTILFLITAAALVIFIQGRIYNRWGLKNVDYSRFFSTPCVFEGDKVQLIEVISNRKPIPELWLRLESYIDSRLKFKNQYNLDIKHEVYHKSFFSLMPYTKITRRHEVNCTKRGYFNLETSVICCNDLFNTIQVRKELSLSAHITVYPKILPVNSLPFRNHSWQGDIVVRRWIMDDPFMICGVREYRYGDPLNRVNWNSTARTGQLQVYNTDHTTNIKLMILLNVVSDQFEWDYSSDMELIEKGITYCASIAHYSISNSIETGFSSNGCRNSSESQSVYVPSRLNGSHIYELLDAMAKMVIKKSVSFHRFMDDVLNKCVNSTHFLIITPYINQQIENSMEKMKKKGNTVEVINLEQNI